jgi:hypothetical protein
MAKKNKSDNTGELVLGFIFLVAAAVLVGVLLLVFAAALGSSSRQQGCGT